jgi:hypothetical protein
VKRTTIMSLGLLWFLALSLWAVAEQGGAEARGIAAGFTSVAAPATTHAAQPGLKLGTPPPVPAASAPDCGPEWSIVQSPNASTEQNVLAGVAVVSSNDVWAVGNYGDGSGAAGLIEHWDGSSWSVVPDASAAPGNIYLYGVAAVSSNDVWAVGTWYYSGSFRHTLTEHWDGTSWNLVDSPSGSTIDNELYGVAAVSSNDVWAVGRIDWDNVIRLRWDGVSWSVVDGPTTLGILRAVAAVSSSDVWAVGTVVEHWNGSVWTVVALPTEGDFYGVSAISHNDVWAVGVGPSGTQTVHWNGSQWFAIQSPNVGTGPNILRGVSAVSSSDVWAVGTYGDPHQPLVEHWNGSVWNVVPSPSASANHNGFNGVAAVSSIDVWAVGSYIDGNDINQTLIERYNLCIGSTTSTSTPTSTSTSQSVYTSTSTSTSTSTATAAPATPTALPCYPVWNVVASPNVGTDVNYLHAISAVSSDDVWAVGYRSNGSLFRTLTEHWDGSLWSVVPSANPPANNVLLGVAAVSSSDVWAVGNLIEHWDGSSWSVVSSPNVGVLYGISAVSSSDIWAVGYYPNGPVYQTLVEHWDGSSWSVVSSPNVGTGTNMLRGVTAISSSDVWAVGNSGPGSLRLHWNGSTWSVVEGSTAEVSLTGVDALSASNVWAVGTLYDGPWQRTLTEHWDGSAWSVVPSPNVGTTHDYLNGVSAVSESDVWAVGTYFNGIADQTLVEHWNGSAWSGVPSANGATNEYNYIYGVAALSSNEVWGVGSYYNGTTYQTLIEEYSPCPGTPTPTVTGTPPTSTPTRTRTSTPVPTSTSTACAITFSDVPTVDAFYPYIRCLVCRGIISGYADGTFRPGNNITRGQIAKMVSNAANINDDPGPQVFEDVDPANPFYLWVNRLSNRGYMSGYPCGGEGEPCNPPLDRPYFRPFANATRGQLSKIVSNTAEVEGAPTGQFYADVAENHPFYLWVMRLTNLGVMSGYQCGGEGEPCDDQQRPYFRPFNDVTRGQASKIVANTFFPGCQTPLRH